MNQEKQTKYAAVGIGLFLAAAALCCLLWILIPSAGGGGYTADIYQNGELIQSISLKDADQPYTFTVTGENGCYNIIEVRPGSIGIRDASCPDKLCVLQGFITDSRLPVTCLPNRLVIRLRPREEQSQSNPALPDTITY
ncbi:MAG: NusG domain II-containing protein [Acetatifactor sp.]|nr:NusG domain II-containing protein [Acetatifactor sp.]MDE7351445.1 NusG domain II-containing protein [Acetatifactor sp.]